MILDRKIFSFSRTISSMGFPLNFITAAMPPSTFLKLTVSWLGFGKLSKDYTVSTDLNSTKDIALIFPQNFLSLLCICLAT